MNKAIQFTLATLLILVLSLGMSAFALADGNVAKVGSQGFDTLQGAVNKANESNGTITLMQNITLGEKLTITGDVTITGDYMITRADTYTGTLFEVKAGAALTLDGGLIIDGGNNYTFNTALYEADLAAMQQIRTAEKYFTPEAGAPVATAYMITLEKGTGEAARGATVNLHDVTIQNHYSVSSGIVNAAQYTTTNLKGAKITHVAGTQHSGIVVRANGAGIRVNMEEDTVIDGNHVGGNHGIFMIYSGTVFTMNGGVVQNTTGWNSNGSVVGLVGGTFIMNGGLISNNSSVFGSSNGRNAAIYLHNNSVMEMNGGTISYNTGRGRGGIDSSRASSKLTITGGEIINNVSLAGNSMPDVGGTKGTWSVTGGICTSDLSQYTGDAVPVVKFDDGTKGLYAVGSEFVEKLQGEYASAANDGKLTITVVSGHVELKDVPKGTEIILQGDSSAALNGVELTGSYTYENPVMTDADDNLYKNGLQYAGSGDVVLKSSDEFAYFVEARLYFNDDETPIASLKAGETSEKLAAKAGSIEITIDESVMLEHGYGKYTLVIDSLGGTVSGEFEYKAPSISGLPQTGDNSNLLLFAALLVLSAAGLTLWSRKRMN